MVAVTEKGIRTPQAGGQREPGKAPRRLWRRLLKTFRGLLTRDRYDPSKHYMRGPGPASLRRAGRITNSDG
jgi:hypothetical protein